MTDESTTCAECGTQNRPSARFCRQCGVPLPIPLETTKARQRVLPWRWITVGVLTLVVLGGVSVLLRPGDEADPLDGQPAPSVDDGGEPVQRPRELSMTLVRGSCTDVEPCRARIAFDGRTDEDIDYEVRFDYRVGDDLTVDTRNEQITEIIGPRDPLCIQVFAVDGERTSRGSNEVCEMAVPGFGLVEADDVVTPLDLERGQCASLVRGEDWSDGIPWVRPAPCSGVTGRVVALRRPAPEVDPQTAIGLCQTAANNDGNAVGLLPSAYFAPDRDGTSTLSCVVHP